MAPRLDGAINFTERYYRDSWCIVALFMHDRN